MTDLQKPRGGNLTVPYGQPWGTVSVRGPCPRWTTSHAVSRVRQGIAARQIAGLRKELSLLGECAQRGEFLHDNNDLTDQEGLTPSINLRKKENFSENIRCRDEKFALDLKSYPTEATGIV